MAVSEINSNAQQAKVYIGDSMSSMELYPSVFCDNLTVKIAPGMSQALLSHKYGRIALAPATRFEDIASIDLRGKFAKITIQNSEGVESTLFIGYIGTQSDTPMGTIDYGSVNIATGNNYYIAYGLDFLLDRITVGVSHVDINGDVIPVDTLFEFNGSSSSQMEKNRSAEKGEISHTFSFTETPEYWTGLDIVEYLLGRFATYSGLTWTLSGDYSYLVNIITTLDPKGKTVRQCLNEVIRPEFGFSYRLLYDTGSDTVYLTITSISDIDIEYDGTKLVPANSNTISLGEVLEYDRTVNNARITRVEQSAYDYIRVISEPVRVMATFTLGLAESLDAGLVSDWDSAKEAAYIAADDTVRQRETYEDVYQKFKLPAEWVKTDFNGVDIIPAVDDETLEVTFSSDNSYVPGVHPFDRTLPLLKDTDNPKSEYKLPVLFIKKTDGTYRVSDKTTFDGDDEAPGIGFRPLDEGPAIQLRCPYNHIVAKNQFTGESEYEALYDYVDMLATLSFYSDAFLKFRIAGVETSGENRTKDIYIPGFHYWYAVAGTKIDVSETKTGILRDDREQMKKLAYLAKAWYGRLRNTLSFNINTISPYSWLGSMITDVYSGGSFTPIGTIVSSMTYDFLSQSITVSTDFADLDFTRISRRFYSSSMKSVNRRIARLEEKLNAVPLRDGRGGGGTSGTDVYLCKITGGTTAAGYTVDIYGNGYDSAATDTGTLQVLDLAQSDDLTTGTRVLGHSASLTITGGSES
ncbi:MAG: hypothetical protein WC900_05210 [Oscillospiraceae bacterium]|jgi:hypothetical protein